MKKTILHPIIILMLVTMAYAQTHSANQIRPDDGIVGTFGGDGSSRYFFPGDLTVEDRLSVLGGGIVSSGSSPSVSGLYSNSKGALGRKVGSFQAGVYGETTQMGGYAIYANAGKHSYGLYVNAGKAGAGGIYSKGNVYGLEARSNGVGGEAIRGIAEKNNAYAIVAEASGEASYGLYSSALNSGSYAIGTDGDAIIDGYLGVTGDIESDGTIAVTDESKRMINISSDGNIVASGTICDSGGTNCIGGGAAGGDDDWGYSDGSGLTGDIYHEGKVGIGTDDPDVMLDVELSSSMPAATIGGPDVSATSFYSIAMGQGTNASGSTSTAIGTGTTASGSTSTAMGATTIASGGTSFAWGGSTIASGLYSTSMGREIEAGGDYAFAVALNDQDGTNCSQDNTMCIMGGNVGIGTTNPLGKLHVNKGNVHFSNSAEDITWPINQHFQMGEWDGTDFTERMRIDKNGNVGIGTTTPDEKLEIAGSLSGGGLHLNSTNGAGIIIDRQGVLNYYQLVFATDGNYQWRVGNVNGKKDLRFYEEGTYNKLTRMTIQNGTGNVGIGTTSPDTKLHVDGGVTIEI